MTPIDSGLAWLEVLREFKRRMPRTNPDVNVSPFDDRVSTSAGGPLSSDLSDMHSGVRAHIRDTISAVKNGKKQSQVILLSGNAGVGKTHLLRTFQTAEAMEQLGHICVGGSNHWKIDEFQARLLDWVIEALTAPSPTGDQELNDPKLPVHPLLERIRAIGFRAVEHLLKNPTSWETCLASPGGRLFGRLLQRWTRPSFAKLQTLVAVRDPVVFQYFDFTKFSSYVCDRFLADRANPLHRFALRVLLIYLFPDNAESGVGTRERVLHWFRGRGDEEYFTKRLGASEQPDRAYSQFEAVKLLAHLFSPAVSAQLSSENAPCEPRVFLLTFDQAEGRNELFENDDDWKTFFAHLSELYNSLPNVVVLFTMTLGLRNRLHGIMERQFRDRIRMDDTFTLFLPTQEQVVGLYRARIENWLEKDDDLKTKYQKLDNQFLPFTREEVIAVGANQTVRQTLENFDTAFRNKIREVTVDAAIDYLFERNELSQAESRVNEWDYTSVHLETVRTLLGAFGPLLSADVGVELREATLTRLDSVPVLRLQIGLLMQSPTITLYLARMGWNYRSQITSLVTEFLYNREKVKTFLCVVRSQPFSESLDLVQKHYQSQFSTGVCSVEVESTFVALNSVNANRSEYAKRSDGPAQLTALDELIRTEVAGTYLGHLFRHARNKIDGIMNGMSASEPQTTTE